MLSEVLTDRDIQELMGLNKNFVKYVLIIDIEIFKARCTVCGDVTDWDYSLGDKPLCVKHWDETNKPFKNNEIYKFILKEQSRISSSQKMKDFRVNNKIKSSSQKMKEYWLNKRLTKRRSLG